MNAADPVQAVAEVIGIHDTLASFPDEGCECSCGATITTDVESYAVGLWREHQAEVYVAAARPAIEREAKAAALRGAADDLPSLTHGQHSEGIKGWPHRDQHIYELAIEEASVKIHDRADRIERESDG